MAQKSKQKKAAVRAQMASKQKKDKTDKTRLWWQSYWMYGGVALLVGVLAVVIAGASQNQYQNGFTRYVVERNALQRIISLNGQVESVRDADLGFETSGRVASISVTEGEYVTEGQEILRLDTTSLEAEQLQAQAVLAVKRASLSEVIRGSRDEETAVLSTALANAESNLAEVIAQQDILVANAYQALLTSDLEAFPEDADTTATPPTVSGYYSGGVEGVFRLVTFFDSTSPSNYAFNILGLGGGQQDVTFGAAAPLGDSGLYTQFTSGDTYRDTIWEIPIPNKQSSSYVTNLNAYESAKKTRQVAVAQAQAELNNARASLNLDIAGSSSEELASAQAEVAQAEAQLAVIEAAIQNRIIKAPFAGVVVNLEVEIGELVPPNTVVAKVLTPGQYQVIMNIPEIDISSVQLGNHVDVALDAYPGEMFDAVVTTIDPAESVIDGVTVYEATLEFTRNDERIRSGMSADADVVVAAVDEALVIPATAITEETGEGKYTVLVEQAGEYRIKEVQLGLRGTNGFVEVVAGLQLGDVVLESNEI